LAAIASAEFLRPPACALPAPSTILEIGKTLGHLLPQLLRLGLDASRVIVRPATATAKKRRHRDEIFSRESSEKAAATIQNPIFP
jgi:hypothetical protein